MSLATAAGHAADPSPMPGGGPMVAPAGPAADAPALERARGRVVVGFAAAGGPTRLATLFQAGSAKARLPRVHGGMPVAVLINTAGGLAGGDRMTAEIRVGDGAAAVATSQAAERLYRSTGAAARVATTLSVGAGGRLDWLPQETIVFDGGRLERSTTVALAGDARFLGIESFVLGRAAMGETVRRAAIEDHWRIRRDGRLVFADALRLVGDPTAILAGPATGGGARAFATLVLAAPDAAGRLDAARALLAASGAEGGVSLVGEVLVARLVAPEGAALRRALGGIVEGLSQAPLPRVWSC